MMSEGQDDAARPTAAGSEKTTDPQTLSQVRTALEGLQFGSVTIIVQDGVVVQIDRTEKRRLRGPRSGLKA
jgi:hypothetical protein